MEKMTEGVVVGCREGKEGDEDEGDGVVEIRVKAAVDGRGGDMVVVIVGTGDWGRWQC